MREMRTSEDWWAVWIGATILAIAFAVVYLSRPADFTDRLAKAAVQEQKVKLTSPLKNWVAKPGKWSGNPIDAFYKSDKQSLLPGLLGVLVVCVVVFGGGLAGMGKPAVPFIRGFGAVFLLATLAYVMAGQELVRHYNLEYALWALGVGLVISNTVGTPEFIKPALRTEFYIKTGLVLLGAGVLFSRLLSLGVPGIFVAWVVTPIVLISTYVFGQKVLKIESRSLNMVIAADMSVCGVSAAIATAAACRAKKEELSFAIGLSLTFTVIMIDRKSVV